jgi:CRP/FNR family transcriptional regulator, cyclic AMP receptor protein
VIIRFDTTKDDNTISLKEIISKKITNNNIGKVKTRQFPKKSTIFFQGDENDKLYEIVDGNVKISKFTADGKEIIIEILRERDCFGFISLIDGGPCECTATALTDVSLNIISFPHLFEILEKVPEIANHLLFSSIKRLRRAYVQMENIVASSVHKRIARILLEMARQEGKYTNKILTFNIRLTHQELGNLAGTSRETVTRVLTQLKNEGYIKVVRSSVSILREDDMETIC